MDSNSRNLKQSIIEYILHETASGAYTDDNLESLEVAKQCLETAWEIEINKGSDGLLKLFEKSSKSNIHVKGEITEDEKKAAEMLKSQGNICMGENIFEDAVSCYTKAIEIDSYNAVYYCNRAAAYSKLNKNESAIADCNQALTIDSKYSKAYSRMGLAYTAMNRFDEAIKCYKQALEIEPDNANYKQNLQAAEEKRSHSNTDDVSGSVNSATAGMPAFQSLLNNVDIGSLLSNPAMMNMAQQFMSQPDMRNMMATMMQSVMNQNPASPGTTPNQEANNSRAEADRNNPNVNEFLTFGQQFAQQMQSANPDLVNTLRQQFQDNRDSDNNPGPQI